MTGGDLSGVGLQAERTALAWRRTALAVGVGAVVGARLTAPGTGTGALVGILAGGLLAVAVWATSERRYRAVHRVLQAGEDLSGIPRPGAALAGLAAVAALTGVLATVAAAR